MSEKYWNAIVREVESGCTCVSFDARGKLQRTVCACSHLPQPPSSPVAAYSAPMNVVTLRMPSRIRDLLSEFLEVLLLVIQPLSKVSGMYVNPNTFQSQMQEHEAQAEYIRSLFDPTLIEQELKHEVFDPSGLFAVIGTTLKGHCAPMRDAAVESMMKAAHACAPGGTGTKRDAVMALKMCMELLELMKLVSDGRMTDTECNFSCFLFFFLSQDIANHQLQTLRPFLLRTSGQFEYKAFKNRHESDSSLDATREWLRKAHEELMKQDAVPLPSDYSTLSRNQQTYLSVLRGLVDLVFESQPPSSPSTPTTPDVTPSEESTSAKPRIFGRPETLYLDHARLSHLHGDSSDALAMQLHLLLYRQLSHSSSTSRQVKPSDLVKIKAEIRDIALGRLAYCLDREQPPSPTSSRSHAERLNAEKENRRDILLQIARRSQEARQPRSHTSNGPCSLPFSAPDESLVNLAQRWADSNMRMNSPLATLSQRRLRNVVFHYVVAMVYPTRHSSTHPITLESLTSSQVKTTATKVPPGIITPDLESITDEICSLGDKISRLALIHLDTYLPLYEQSNLLD